MLACLEATCRHRGLLERMLPAPLASLDEPTARRVVEAIEAVGYLPEPEHDDADQDEDATADSATA